MECFAHPQQAAVGMCKSCFKGLCKVCAIATAHGLACSETCAIEVDEMAQMNERGKKIYGIGARKSRVPSSGVIIWALFAVIMWALFLIPYIADGSVSYESLVMAVLFSIVAGIAYYSAKRTGLQC